MGKVKALFHLLFKTNFIVTIWFNLKFLPFKQACKLPIFIYGKLNIRNSAGKIILNFGNIRTGIIKIGRKEYKRNQEGFNNFLLEGTIVFNGPINIYSNNYIYINKNAVLTFGTHGTFLGTNNTIICFERITLGDNVRVTWDCQIMDSSFHYIKIDDNYSGLTSPVIINKNVWIGNRTTIMKGTKINSNTIISSNSLLNKDYSNLEQNILLGGIPAKLIKRDVYRLFDDKLEADLDKKFIYKRTRL